MIISEKNKKHFSKCKRMRLYGWQEVYKTSQLGQLLYYLVAVHSVRGASSTMAANLGITTNDILKAADWSTESVFLYKSMDNPSFGRAVFSARESA